MSVKSVLYDWGGINVELFHAINDTRDAVLDPFMVWGTLASNHTNFPFFIAFVLLLAWLGANRRRSAPIAWLDAATLFAISYLVGAAAVGGLKAWLDLPRPPLALAESGVRLLLPAEYHHSFPSGHVFFATTFAASIWRAAPPPGRWLAAFFVVWSGLSRIKVGAHFPADVVWSVLVAAAVVLLVRAAMTSCEALLRRTGVAKGSTHK